MNEDTIDFAKPMTDSQILEAALRTTHRNGIALIFKSPDGTSSVLRGCGIPGLPDLERVEYCEFGFVEYREAKGGHEHGKSTKEMDSESGEPEA